MMLPRLLPAAVTPVPLPTLLKSIFHMTGSQDADFNNTIAKYFSARDVFTFSSLMRTVYASLLPLKKDIGKRYVILPRYSCPSFAHGILANDLTIRYVDQDPQTLAFDMKDLKSKMGKDVLAIIVPHFFGLAHQIDEICDMARRSSVTVIEGVDYSIGSVFKGRKLGTFGDIGILNFQEGKAIPIGGGALIINNKSLVNLYAQFKDRYRPEEGSTILKMFGFAIGTHPFVYFFIRHGFSLMKKNIKHISFEDTIRDTASEYDYEFNEQEPLYSLTQFQKRLGLLLLQQMDNNMQTRQENAKQLEKSLTKVTSIQLIVPHKGLDAVHYIRYPILVKKQNRSDLIKALYAEGIEASSMYTDHGMSIDSKEYPGAAEIYNRLLTLPVNPYCTKEDIDNMIRVVSGKSKL